MKTDKPFDIKTSLKVLKSLFYEYKNKTRHGHPSWNNIKPGMIMLYRYDAKDKTKIFDKYPLTLILHKKGNYMLGVNLHWIEIHSRIRFVTALIKSNTDRTGKFHYPLRFNYKQLVPLLKHSAYRNCVRLYIKRKVTSVGIIIEPIHLMDVARMKLAQFVKPK